MFSKKLFPVLAIALLLIGAAAAVAGATGSQQVRQSQGSIVTSPNADKGVVDTGRPQVPTAPQNPPARANSSYNDDFSADTLNKYEPLASAPGAWKVKDNRLQQRGTEDDDLGEAPAALVVKGSLFSDSTLDVQVFPVAMPAGVVFRGSDTGYYRFTIRREQAGDASKAVLEKVVGDKVTTIASADSKAYAGFTPNTWQAVQVNAAGSHITASVNGKQVLDATDASFAAGWAGVWAPTDAATQFDNVRISSAGANR